MWFGGVTMHSRLTKRLIEYGSGMMCARPLSAD